MVHFACDYGKNVDTKLNKNQDPNEGRQLNGLLLNTLYVEVYIFSKSSYGSEIWRNDVQEVLNCALLVSYPMKWYKWFWLPSAV